MKIDYSANGSNNSLLKEIESALKNIQWGSLEIYVQDSKVIQITERNIKKVKTKEVSAKNSQHATGKSTNLTSINVVRKK